MKETEKKYSEFGETQIEKFWRIMIQNLKLAGSLFDTLYGHPKEQAMKRIKAESNQTTESRGERD